MENMQSLRILSFLLVPTAVAVANPPSGYNQVFRDDFDYSMDSAGRVDFRGNWYYHPPEAQRWEAGDGWNTADAASIKGDSGAGNGKALSLKVFTDPSKSGQEEQTRGAAISTWDYSDPNKADSRWAYGYFEMRARFPATAPATWSSFWLFNFDWDGAQKRSYLGQTEIDIMEFREHYPEGDLIQRYEIFSNVHFGWDSQVNAWSQNQAMTITPTDYDPRQYHTYGLLWTENGYDVFLDGRKVHSMPTKINVWDYGTSSYIDVDVLYSEPHSMFLSAEARPGFTGPALDPAGYGTRENPRTEMIIDYVAVYQSGGSPITTDNEGDSEDNNDGGSWSLHDSLGWVYDSRTGWQFSSALSEWFWIDGQWGWTQDGGWHWLGTPRWVYRLQDESWFQVQ